MKRILLVCALTVLTVSAVRAQFVWYDGHHPVSYQVVGRVDPVVQVALQMFSDDIEQVTGQRPEAVRRDATAATMASVSASPLSASCSLRATTPVAPLMPFLS